jgi:hypothetical protein
LAGLEAERSEKLQVVVWTVYGEAYMAKNCEHLIDAADLSPTTSKTWILLTTLANLE